MTWKNAKTILFASLIAAMILPFSMGDYAAANANDGEINADDSITMVNGDGQIQGLDDDSSSISSSNGESKLSIATGSEIETNYTQLERAHSDVSDIMVQQAETPLEIYDGPDIPIVMAYIDDDVLVLGLDPIAMYFDPPIESELIQHILDLDEVVEIKYVAFEDEASASTTKSWQDRYKNHCMPVKSGYAGACKTYENVMKRIGVPLPSGSSGMSTQTNSGNPCDASSSSSACYYYKQYEKKCTNGKTYKRCNTYASQITSAGYSLPGSSSSSSTTPTTTPTVTPTYELTNITAAKSGDDITVSWDAPTDFKVKYYKIYVSENGDRYNYKSRIYAPNASYTLSDADDGKSYKFKIKLYFVKENGKSDRKYFYSNSVTMHAAPVDRTPPVITVPQDIRKTTPSNTGVAVDFNVSVTDNSDESIFTQCSHTSGSTFAPGTTKVNCSATDKAGNISTVSFNIIVEWLRASSILPTEFYGGNQFQIFLKDPISGRIGNGNSTLTLGVTTNDGVKGFIVSGHAVKPLLFVKEGVVVNNEFTSISDKYPDVKNKGNIDAAFAPITEPNIVIGSKVQGLDGTVIDVTHGSVTGIPDDAEVKIYGIHHNSAERIVAKGATITTKGDVLYTNMALSTYSSSSGDSGAPVIYHEGNSAKIVGVHKGTVCVFNVPSDDPITYADVRNTTWCKDKDPVLGQWDDDVDRYKTFTPWETVRTAFNLQ